MKLKSVCQVAALLTLAMGAQARAQMFAYSAHKITPASCTGMSELQMLVSEYPHPAAWKYADVCDESSWRQVVREFAPVASDPDTVYGITLPSSHITFFRGTRIAKARPDEPTPDHIVAHELAHIYLNSPDDSVVDALAKEWMAKRNEFDTLSAN